MEGQGGAFRPTRVEEVYEVLKTSTEPVRVRTDAGPAYLKHPANRASARSLACEWVGTRLAQRLGLTTFDTVQLDYDGRAGLVLEGGLASPARCFVTREERGETWDETGASLGDLDRPDDLARLVVLDTWLRNGDRHVVHQGQAVPNPSNVYLSSERSLDELMRLIAMDFSQLLLPLAFGSGEPASGSAVRSPSLYGLFPQFVPYLRRQPIVQALENLVVLDRKTLLEILLEVPDEWGVDSNVREATARFLLERAAFLGETLVPRIEAEHPTQFGFVEEGRGEDE